MSKLQKIDKNLLKELKKIPVGKREKLLKTARDIHASTSAKPNLDNSN